MNNGKKEELVEVDGNLYVIDKKGKGETVYSDDTEESLKEQQEIREGEYFPDPNAKRWKQLVHPPPSSHSFAGLDPPGTKRMCKKENCANIVPRSKNPGKKRLFCAARCAHAHASLMYNRRKSGVTGNYLQLDDQTREQLQFFRVKPAVEKIATALYKAHLERGMCPNATQDTHDRCPAHMYKDNYSEKRLCLIYATLVDDMKEIWARGWQEVYPRQYTTNDGRWLDLSELAPHVEPNKRIVPEEMRDAT